MQTGLWKLWPAPGEIGERKRPCAGAAPRAPGSRRTVLWPQPRAGPLSCAYPKHASARQLGGRESTKFLTMRMPLSVMIDSGWNCTPWMCGCARCRTPMMVPSSHLQGVS